jgi:hypothetical protein
LQTLQFFAQHTPRHKKQMTFFNQFVTTGPVETVAVAPDHRLYAAPTPHVRRYFGSLQSLMPELSPTTLPEFRASHRSFILQNIKTKKISSYAEISAPHGGVGQVGVLCGLDSNIERLLAAVESSVTAKDIRCSKVCVLPFLSSTARV